MLFDSDYNEAKSNLDKAVSANAGTTGAEKANRTGTVGALGLGQTSAEVARGTASSSGLTKGQAAGIAQNVANSNVENDTLSEANKAQQKQNDYIKEQENKVGEAAEQMKEKQSRLSNTVQGGLAGAATGATIGSFGGPIGIGIGAGIGGLIGGIGSFFSDERLKYKSRIKDKRLLSLGVRNE